MKDHILFKMAIGTNFRLEDKQVSALNKLIDDQYGIEAIAYLLRRQLITNKLKFVMG